MNYIFYIYDNVYTLHKSKVSYATINGQKPQQKLPPKTPTKTPYDPPKICQKSFILSPPQKPPELV